MVQCVVACGEFWAKKKPAYAGLEVAGFNKGVHESQTQHEGGGLQGAGLSRA